MDLYLIFFESLPVEFRKALLLLLLIDNEQDTSFLDRKLRDPKIRISFKNKSLN